MFLRPWGKHIFCPVKGPIYLYKFIYEYIYIYIYIYIYKNNWLYIYVYVHYIFSKLASKPREELRTDSCRNPVGKLTIIRKVIARGFPWDGSYKLFRSIVLERQICHIMRKMTSSTLYIIESIYSPNSACTEGFLLLL